MSRDRDNTAVIGKPLDRIDGIAKVTGKATYAAEYQFQNLAYGVVIQSSIPNGQIKSFDSSAAEQIPGVVAVYSYANQPMTLPTAGKKEAKNLFLLQDAVVHFSGQIIGLVVADSLETAKHAASLVKVSYDLKPFNTDFPGSLSKKIAPKSDTDYQRGDVVAGLAKSAVKLELTYTTPMENHNPMEPFATIAEWQDGGLTLYDSTQAVFPTRDKVAKVLGLAPDKVRVVSHYVGGGFGSKLSVWPHLVLSAMAANKLRRPVKIVLDRHQMYGPVGFRPATTQKITLGAAKDGSLVAISHDSISETSRFTEFLERTADASRMVYACPNVQTSHRVVELDIGQPTWMRAPGHATGSFALESAIDELAYELNIDPIELRLKNYAESDPESGLPWSSKSLKECYKLGAQRFGWQKRNPKPGSMRDGRLLVGFGTATALHTVWRNSAAARIQLTSDGKALVQSGSQEIGTGTYTIMTQIAAERLTLPVDHVRFELGDSMLPRAPLSGGSTTSVSVGNAVAQAADAAIKKLIAIAVADSKSSLYQAAPGEIEAWNGQLRLKSKSGGTRSEKFSDIISRTPDKSVEVTVETKLDDAEKKFSMCSFGSQFVEVKVDPDIGMVHVSRVVGTYGAGTILNAKTARSQMLGGITFGIGMALTEHTVIDHNLGRIINADFAEYHLPVHADLGEIEVSFVEEEDLHINDLGAKGIGELGITGVAAAIANAVYHATGKRVRDLPITLDKLV
jgi:xanthine dehydrogenase YagR molybdenum-binding subunit